MGNVSMQLACARARRCMNGDRLELSGLNSFAAMAFVTTYRVRSASIKIKRSNVQPTKPRRAIADAFTARSSPKSRLRIALACAVNSHPISQYTPVYQT